MLLTDQQRDSMIAAVDRAEVDAQFPTDAMRLAREAGLLSVEMEATDDVRDVTTMVQSIYEAGRVSASLGTIVSMHLQQVHTIALHGSPKLKELLAEQFRNGSNYVGSITTETGSGGDLRTSNSTLERTSNGTVLLDRAAPIVTGGLTCDSYLIKVAEPDSGNSIVYVPRDDADVHAEASTWDPMGMRGSASVSLTVRATVPDWYVVGSPGQFDRIVSDSFGVFAHIGWAAAWLGTATECGNQLIKVIRDRPALRRKMADNDLMLTRLASARSALDTVRLALDSLVSDYAQGKAGTTQFAIRTNDLKVLASVRCFDAVNTMIDVGGLPFGYMRNPHTRLERAFRDLRSASMNYSNDKLAIANGKLTLRAGFGSSMAATRTMQSV